MLHSGILANRKPAILSYNNQRILVTSKSVTRTLCNTSMDDSWRTIVVVYSYEVLSTDILKVHVRSRAIIIDNSGHMA